ncbi:MAG: M28 family peptidase [Anaeroplasmataceae bacterium]|nr:M28 family peptidase [Anaeroplasmataceae bacterium]
MENYGSFDFLKKIAFERVAGSEEELKVANMIITECHKYQVEAHLEDFEIDGYTILKASLEAIDGAYEVTGIGMSGQTSQEGVVGEFIAIESDDHLESFPSLEGKIVFLPSRVMVKTYKLLCEKKASGFICASGSLYDDRNDSDLEKMAIRERHYAHGKVPGVAIRRIDAQRLLLSNPKEVKLTLLQEETKKISHNVVATIPGTSLKEEIICFTAHYDSVPFSTGAYDNGTGTTTILESLAYFSKHQPKRTLKFVWCGAEEIGLMGSKAYTEQHKEELKQYKLNINVDMTGVVIGSDIACCTSEDALPSYINYLGKELGFPIQARQGGTTTILESLAYFSKHQPKRTLKFVWCGAEEIGLMGSKAYTEQHKEELKQYKLNINVDMTGVVIGSDIACCTSEDALPSYINYLGKELGFPIQARQGVYSSDSTPFADHGIPALSFARVCGKGGAEIHSRRDVLDFLDSKNYYATTAFINQFATRMIESVFFPVKPVIPSNMQEELDIYLGRKERPEKK